MPRRRRERGIALLLTLVLIVAMMGMGFLAVYFASSGVGLSSNLGARQAAMNAAQAGIQHARLVLSAAQTAGTYGSCASPSVYSCVLLGRNNAKDSIPSASNLSGIGAIVYDANTQLVDYPSPPATVGTALGYYTVYIRNDASEVSSGQYTTDGNTTLIVRSVGQDVGKSATVVVEAALMQTSTAGGGSNANTVFGKNIDPYGSNAITGAFHF